MPKLATGPLKTFFLIAGGFMMLLGIIGVFLPVLPTAPFVVLAAYCFSRSSKKFHNWLRESKWFGEMVCEWEDQGVIGLPAKLGATFFIVISLAYALYFDAIVWIPLSIILFGGIGLGFVWTRPSKSGD